MDSSKADKGTEAEVFGPGIKHQSGLYPSVFQAEINTVERCAELNVDKNYLNQIIAKGDK